MQYIIRPVHPRDAQAMHAMRTMPGVMEMTTAMPSERLAHSEAFIGHLGENDHQFVAVTPGVQGEEVLIGSAGISIFSGRKRHCAGLGIMVHREYRGQGVGSALMEKVLDIADNWLGLTRVELTVLADNTGAIRMYEKYGFVREGHHRMAILRAGQYCDALTMARIRNHD